MKESDKTKNPNTSEGQGLNDDTVKVQKNRITPDILTDAIHKSMKGSETIKGDNSFPVDVFPKIVHDIIKATNENLNFTVDFMSTSILYAVSVAIGNTHKVEIKKGWTESAVIYLAIIAMRGTNKSAPLSFALKPIDDIDTYEDRIYREAKKEYKSNEKLDKDEKNDLEQPIKKQLLVADFTVESLNDVLDFNIRGIGAYNDELASWINNFTRYNRGSEEQYWLSVWSGKILRINRKTSDPIFILHPFISVIGTIQPKTLNDLLKGKIDNGFLDRLLLVYVKDIQKEYWSENEIDQAHIDNWKIVLDRILKIPLNRDTDYNIDPIILRPSQEAKQKLYEWQKQITDKSNNSDDEIVKGIYAKIEMYALRLSLILELMNWACDESDRSCISIKSVNGSIRLCEYFFKSALQVHEIVLNDDPVVNLPESKQNLYNKLPEIFHSKDGVILAKDFEIFESTFRRFITKKELFKNIGKGYYKKLL